MAHSHQLHVDDRQDLRNGHETDWPLGSQRIRVSLLFLHLCAQVVDHLASCYSVFPFMLPVPSSATVYHREVGAPMDLSTLEAKLFRGEYKTFRKFQDDLVLIWQNAQHFHHDPATPIHRMADILEQRYKAFIEPLQRDRMITVPQRTVPLPEEADLSMYTEVPPESLLYFLQLTIPSERVPKTRMLKGSSDVSYIYDQLNGPFFRAVHAIKHGQSLPEMPFPRMYLAKNRTLMLEAHARPKGIVAVLMNTDLKPYDGGLSHLISDVVLVRPLSSPVEYDIKHADTIHPTEFLPKAWVKVKIIRVIPKLQTVVTPAMKKQLFYRPFSTHRLTNNRDMRSDPRDMHFVALFTQAILDGKTSLEPASVYQTAPAAAAPSSKRKPSSSSTSTVPSSVASTSSSSSSASHEASGKRRKLSNSTASSSSSSRIQQQTPSPSLDKESEQQVPVLSRFSSVDENAQHPVTPPESQQSTQGLSFTKYLDASNEQGTEQDTNSETAPTRDYYLNQSRQLWQKVFAVCDSKSVPVIHVNKYLSNTSSFPNAEGYFKHVYYVHNDPSVVVQTFRRMTITQRTTELVSLLAVHGLAHMAQIVEVLKEDSGEIIGLSMRRYQKTLKQYTHKHSHHRLTAHQKMDLIRQMLVCMCEIHALGIAHRDLSEVNFMVDETPEKLPDGSPRAHVYLIDFGKSVFTRPDDVRRWWVDRPPLREDEYEGEMLPETRDELDEWCRHLPWVRCKPDHGYRHYRSIQTLPRSRYDHETLPHLVHPMAEDMYSIGTLIWKTFAESEPWYGILDTDLRGLRDRVQSDYTIDAALEREVQGELSRELLSFCLRAGPEDRKPAVDVLQWLDAHERELIDEWTLHAPQGRRRRRAKAVHQFEEEQARPQRSSRKARAAESRRNAPETAATAATASAAATSGNAAGARRRGRPRLVFKNGFAQAADEAATSEQLVPPVATIHAQPAPDTEPIPVLQPPWAAATMRQVPSIPSRETAVAPDLMPVGGNEAVAPAQPKQDEPAATLIRLPREQPAFSAPQQEHTSPSSPPTVIRLPPPNTQSRSPLRRSSRSTSRIPPSSSNVTHTSNSTSPLPTSIRLLLPVQPPPSSPSAHHHRRRH